MTPFLFLGVAVIVATLADTFGRWLGRRLAARQGDG